MPFSLLAQSFLPADARWAGVVLLLIFGWFLAALVIGIVARMVMPERYSAEKALPKH